MSATAFEDIWAVLAALGVVVLPLLLGGWLLRRTPKRPRSARTDERDTLGHDADASAQDRRRSR